MRLKITLMLIAGFIVFSCSPDQEEVIVNNETADFLNGLGGATTGTNSASELDVDLMAGQNILSGIVNVTVSNGDVQVTYSADGDWVITETHLYIGDISNLPTTGSGNPKIGHFPYTGIHNINTYDVVYTGPALNEGECTFIAAHAVVVNTVTGQEETAWGFGDPLGGNSWAMGFEYCY